MTDQKLPLLIGLQSPGDVDTFEETVSWRHLARLVGLHKDDLSLRLKTYNLFRSDEQVPADGASWNSCRLQVGQALYEAQRQDASALFLYGPRVGRAFGLRWNEAKSYLRFHKVGGFEAAVIPAPQRADSRDDLRRFLVEQLRLDTTPVTSG